MYPALNQSHRRITVRLKSPNADFLGHHPNKGVAEAVFAEIAERFSGYKASKSRIELMLPLGHPDLDAFIEYAKTLDLVVMPSSKEQSQVEILDYTKPSLEDLAAARYVECGLFEPVFVCFTEIGSDLGLGLESESLAESKNLEFGSILNLPHLIVVRGEAKRKIESSNLSGLSLLPVPTELSDRKWPDGLEPLFFVWSSVILPEIDTEVLQAEGGCRLVDGYEIRPQLRYLKGIPETDIGLSHEIFGSSECYRRIVYSQKAKMVLEECGMKLEYVPVRVK